MLFSSYRAIDYTFDVAVADRDGHVVALVEVKERPRLSWPELLGPRLKNAPETVEFILAVDTRDILVYRVDGRELGECVASLKSDEVFSLYDPGFSGRRVFHPYLITLAEAWLRDLAYHWKSDRPPGSDALAGIGLLRRLEGGTTVGSEG